MSGEVDLQRLLANMRPVLAPDAYIFISVSQAALASYDLSEIDVMVRESEGVTLILPAKLADKYAVEPVPAFARITLQVHSSLEAVGLTAAISARLTAANITANVVAGYYHDHIYVAEQDGRRAVEILSE